MRNLTKKSLILIAMVTLLSSLNAEPLHQFNVKSGKIVYEHKKFKTKMSYKYINGKEESTREVIPYVDTRENYYWTNYGDVVFREVYQVSKFGGKLLPKPVKKFEQLFKDDKRYYYNVKKQKASYDPWREKEACLKKAESLDDRGCFSVYYPKMEEKGEEVIAGKSAQGYKESMGTDIYLWKGLNLKEQNFSFNNTETKRYNIEREMVAVEIDTNTTIDPQIFNPKWLNQFSQ